jgi:hypothetical protein
MNALAMKGGEGARGVAGDGAPDAFAAVAQLPRKNARAPKVINQTANPILHPGEFFMSGICLKDLYLRSHVRFQGV